MKEWHGQIMTHTMMKITTKELKMYTSEFYNTNGWNVPNDAETGYVTLNNVLVTWNGSATFNVYNVDWFGNTEIVTVFTRYDIDNTEKAEVAMKEWLANYRVDLN